MIRALSLFFMVPSIVLAQEPVAAVEAAVGFIGYWPYIIAILLAVSEILAISPLKANGIVDIIVKIIKAIAGKK